MFYQIKFDAFETTSESSSSADSSRSMSKKTDSKPNSARKERVIDTSYRNK